MLLEGTFKELLVRKWTSKIKYHKRDAPVVQGRKGGILIWSYLQARKFVLKPSVKWLLGVVQPQIVSREAGCTVCN